MVLENENALNAEEVAKILKIGRNAVYDMAKTGELRSYRIGRKLRFTYDDIQAYIDSQKTGGTISSGVNIAASNNHGSSAGFTICGHDAMLSSLIDYTKKRGAHITLSAMNSYDALHALYKDEVSAACCHVFDAETGTYNEPFVRRMLPGTGVVIIHLAKRTQGLLVAEGNPRNIRGIKDLTSLGVRLANREKGSGARIYLDSEIKRLGLNPRAIEGYNTEIDNEIMVATKVARGAADVGIGHQLTASQFEGLQFIPLVQEDYVLVMKEQTVRTDEAKTLLSVLASGELQDAYACTSGYDTSDMGRYVIINS